MLSLSREEGVQHTAGALLWRLVLFEPSTISLGLVSQHPEEWRDLLPRAFFWKAPAMIFFAGHVFDSLASCRPIRECLRGKRFIPRQTPARGAGRSPVHHRRPCRFGARRCSKVLCYLAYFSLSLKWAFSKLKLQLRAHGGQRETGVKPTSQRENCLPCQRRGPPRPEWHPEQMTGTWVLANRGMDDLIQEKGGRIVLAWPSGNLQQKQNRMRHKYCLDQREKESAGPAQQREGWGVVGW